MTDGGDQASWQGAPHSPFPAPPAPCLHLVGCQLAQGAQQHQNFPGRNCGCWGAGPGWGTGRAESQEPVHGQEQDSTSTGSATGTAPGHHTPTGQGVLGIPHTGNCIPHTQAPSASTSPLLLPGLSSPFPAQLPQQLCPALAHPSWISYFLSAFISRQSHPCCESPMPPAPSLLLPGSPDKGPLYLIVLPGSYTLMVSSPGLGRGRMSSVHPLAGSKQHWVMW